MLVQFVQFTFAPQDADKAEAILRELRDASRKEDGVVGFDVVRDFPYGTGQRWVELAPAGAATTIALVAASPTAPAGVETGIRFST